MAEGQGAGRTLSPQWQAFWTAIIYMITVLVLVGGSGIWLPMIMPGKYATVDAVVTFVMAILSPIFVDLLLDFEVYGLRLSKLWRMGFMGASILAACFAITGLLRESASHGWTAAIAALVLSLLIWLALVLKCDRFVPSRPFSGSIGGQKPNPADLGGGGLS